MQYTCSKFLTSVLVFYTIHLNNQVLPAVSNSSERKVPVKLKVKLAGNRVGTERSRGVHEWAVHGRRYRLCLVSKFVSSNFIIHLSHQICLLHAWSIKCR